MTPILYKATVQSRFSDLDPYGHVNFKHFFDYVISSRLIFLENKFDLDLDKIAKTGYGFYATQGEIKFLRPIVGLRTLDVETFVESVKDEVTLIIPFTIKDAKTSKVNSEGKLHFTIIDLKTGKPAPLNETLKGLFFE
jgi:acyl-CoA thioesterase FadM